MIKFHHADCLEWAKDYTGPLYHALLCDPPYHLESIVKRFGSKTAAVAKPGRDGAFQRVSRGFMGEEWDGGDIAFRSDTWAAFWDLLYPGAFCVAFSGSRGWHRMAVAIEDAGYIIHPTLFGWAYSSGLPKAHKVNDDRFHGHRYGLQALKPALEPIVIFQKPYKGRALTNIVETGAGTLNIEATRIPTNGRKVVINRYNGLRPFGGGDGPYKTEVTEQGLYPANFLVLDHEAGAALGKNAEYFFQVDEQFDSADPVIYCKKANTAEKESGLDLFPDLKMGMSNQAQAEKKRGENHKNRKGEIGLNRIRNRKNPHPAVKPLSLTRYLASLLLPPVEYAPRRVLVPFSGVGSEAIGAALAGWEEVDGIEITKKYIPYAEARAAYWLSLGVQNPMI